MEEKKSSLKRELGFFSMVAIIVGQMIGSGIYMAPQGLAELANPVAAVLAILITGVGTVFLSISFARIGVREDTQGSAIISTRMAFGDLPGFWMGWLYWCGCWIANGAIILAGLSYVSYFIPVLAVNSFPRFLACVVVIWFYTIIDIWGTGKAGLLNLIVTIVKLVPLLLFVVVAAIGFEGENFRSVAAPELAGMHVLPAGIAYALWSFMGFEGASVNAEGAKDQKSVAKVTVVSTAAVVVIYLLIIITAAGAAPQGDLAVSASPLADVIQHVTGGYWAGAVVALGGAVSALGCAGPWIMSGGSTAYMLGKNELLPRVFAKVHPKYGTPVAALLINGVLMTLIMMLAWLTQEGSLYNFFVMLSVSVFLVYYALGAASEIVLAGKKIRPMNVFNFVKCSIISLVGLVYAIYTVYGSGADYMLYCFLLMMMGIPVFAYVRLKNESLKENGEALASEE